jgi:hypothetical protein
MYGLEADFMSHAMRCAEPHRDVALSLSLANTGTRLPHSYLVDRDLDRESNIFHMRTAAKK